MIFAIIKTIPVPSVFFAVFDIFCRPVRSVRGFSGLRSVTFQKRHESFHLGTVVWFDD